MRAFLLVMVLGVPSIALAQDPPVHELPVTHITAAPPRPHAVILLPRARVRFDRTDGSHHAVDRIVESVRHDPF